MSTDNASEEPPTAAAVEVAPVETTATVFTVSLEAVVFEFSLPDSAADAEPQIGYVRPNQIRVGNRLIPAAVRKVETLTRYVDSGDELRVKVVRVAEADHRTITYTEDGDGEGEGGEVEIQPEWVAVECEKKEHPGSPPPPTPSTPVTGVGKKRVSNSGGKTPTTKAAKSPVKTATVASSAAAKKTAAKAGETKAEVKENTEDAAKGEETPVQEEETEQNGTEEEHENGKKEEEEAETMDEEADIVEDIQEGDEEAGEDKEEEEEDEEKGKEEDFVLEVEVEQDDDFAAEAQNAAAAVAQPDKRPNSESLTTAEDGPAAKKVKQAAPAASTAADKAAEAAALALAAAKRAAIAEADAAEKRATAAVRARAKAEAAQAAADAKAAAEADAAAKARQLENQVFIAKVVQFKKPTSDKIRDKVVHGIMELVNGPFSGKRAFFQTSSAYVWGHHLARANLMYNIRAGDMFRVEITLKTITSACNDANDVPLVVRKCWLGIQCEDPQDPSENVDFSSWLVDRDVSPLDFKKWINDRLPPRSFFPLPSETYKAKVILLIRESPKCEGGLARITEEGPLKDALVLFEREDFYVSGVSVGGADLRFLVRPGDPISVQVQTMTGREKQLKTKKYPKAEEYEFNHCALLAYAGSKRPQSSDMQPKDSTELRSFLENIGLSIDEFQEMRKEDTATTEASPSKTGGLNSSSSGLSPVDPLSQLPSLMSLPPFNTPAAAIFNPNMPGPGSIPPMGAKEMEMLAKFGVILARAIYIEETKAVQPGLKLADIMQTEEDIELAVKMGKWMTEALVAKMTTHLQEKVKSKVGPNFGTVLSSQKTQIQAAATALLHTNMPPPKLLAVVPPPVGKPMSAAMSMALQNTLQSINSMPPPPSTIEPARDPAAALSLLETQQQAKKQLESEKRTMRGMTDMKKRLEAFKAAKEPIPADSSRRGRDSDRRSDRDRGRDRSPIRRRSDSPADEVMIVSETVPAPPLDKKEAAEEREMPPLQLLRKYVMRKLPMRMEGDQVVFRGELSYHKDTRTNFTISHNSEARGGPKEYYTVGTLYYFIQFMDLDHPKYIRKALAGNLPVIRRPDRQNLVRFLTGETDYVLNMDNISHRELNPHLVSVAELTMQRGGGGGYSGAVYGDQTKEYGGSGGGMSNEYGGGRNGESARRNNGTAAEKREYGGGGRGGNTAGAGQMPSESIFKAVDLVSAKLAQAAPEASQLWKEQPSTAIERWKAKNLKDQEKAGGNRSSRFDSELRRRSRSRSRERLRNKDLAIAGGNRPIDTSNPFSMGRPGAAIPPPSFGRDSSGRGPNDVSQTAAGFNPFDRSSSGVGGSMAGRGGLLATPGSGADDPAGGMRFGGGTLRAQNPFDNRGFGNNTGTLGGVETIPAPRPIFDTFPAGGTSGAFGGSSVAGDFRPSVSFGSGLNPFDNRGGDANSGSLLGEGPTDPRFGSNPFDRRRSRFDEPPSASSQIQRPGVWNENDQRQSFGGFSPGFPERQQQRAFQQPVGAGMVETVSFGGGGGGGSRFQEDPPRGFGPVGAGGPSAGLGPMFQANFDNRWM